MAWQRYVGKIEDDYTFDRNSVGPPSAAPSSTKDRPGPIDNSDLIINEVKDRDEDLQLHRTLEEGRDYVLVPEEVWEGLLKWYFCLMASFFSSHISTTSNNTQKNT